MSNDFWHLLKETCVYWSPLYPDGKGGFTTMPPFTSSAAAIMPSSIRCRWDENVEMTLNAQGEEVKSDVQVYTEEALQEGGFLFNGIVADAPADPSTSRLCHRIIRIETSGDIDKVKTIRKALA